MKKKSLFASAGEQEQKIEIEAANTPVLPPMGKVTVVKQIKEDEITWAHGNPVFRFKVSGTDVKGKTHTYEIMLNSGRANIQRKTAMGS